MVIVLDYSGLYVWYGMERGLEVMWYGRSEDDVISAIHER